jgi:hypothetical protein
VNTDKTQTELELLALMERAHAQASQMHVMCSGLKSIIVPNLQKLTVVQTVKRFIIFTQSEALLPSA